MSDDTRLARIEDKVDKIDTTLAGIGVDVAYHIKRTDMLEAELKPLKTQLDMAAGAIKVLGLVATILTVLEAIRAFK